MFNFFQNNDIQQVQERHFKLLCIILFLTYLIGIFITRGHSIVAVLAFITLLIFTPYPRQIPKLSSVKYVFFSLFSLTAIITSAAFSPNTLYALGSAGATIGFFAVGLYLWEYAKNITPTQCNKLYDFSRIAVRISSILLTALLTIPALLELLHPSQVAESVMNRTVVAHTLLSGIFILASMRRKQTFDAWSIYIWAASIALLSQSETAKLVCIAAPIAYLMFRFLGNFARALTCAIILGYSLAAPWVAGSFYTFIKTLPTSSATFRGAFGARAEIWDGVAQMVQRQPFTGYGFESMRLIKDLPIQGIFWTERAIAHPHNMALQVWADLGVVGAVVVALAFCYLIWESRKLPIFEATATASFVLMVFLICQISHGAWQNWWLGVIALSGFFVHILFIKTVISDSISEISCSTETSNTKFISVTVPIATTKPESVELPIEKNIEKLDHIHNVSQSEVSNLVTQVRDTTPTKLTKNTASNSKKASHKKSIPADKKTIPNKKPAVAGKSKSLKKPRASKKTNDNTTKIAAG